MLAIVDYEAGNQTSVARALKHLGIPCRITSQPGDLTASQGVIFPGVGSAPQAMAQLKKSGLDKILIQLVRDKVPMLGICLGSQIVLETSEEGPTKTLGLARGVCKRFASDLREEDGAPAKIPHMGWNSLAVKKENRILQNIPATSQFYFVHSYYTAPDPELVLATSHYGHEFCAVFGYDGFWCAQFHPEKSGRPGLAFLENFYNYCQERSHAV